MLAAELIVQLYFMPRGDFFIPCCDRQEFVQAFAASHALPGALSTFRTAWERSGHHHLHKTWIH